MIYYKEVRCAGDDRCMNEREGDKIPLMNRWVARCGEVRRGGEGFEEGSSIGERREGRNYRCVGKN